MTSRWTALAILFATRMTMAFQYQAVAALGPLMMQRHNTGLADLGILIGLYTLPGLVFALPGAGLSRVFGDRRTVIASLLVMLVGAVLMWQGSSWNAQIAGRLLAGIGGTLLNVLMTKMLADWFAGRNMATAMGIFVNSWPVGIALALVTLPPLAEQAGVAVALGATTALTLAGLALFALLYRNPPEGASAPKSGVWPRGTILTAVLLAGGIWGLYNSALVMVFAFGPTLLVERGSTLATASATVSLTLWLGALSVPAGGMIADRLGRPDTVLALGLIGFALSFGAVLSDLAPVISFALVGLVFGLSAGPIMALPTRVLPGDMRALGMGLFFTIYYAAIVFAPVLAGWLADSADTARPAFYLGIAMLVMSLGALIAFQRVSVAPR